MRIHNLSISNIASLRGEHFINFDKINESSNLFAITGKTGAGKSTILNCISLALYGDVYKRGSNSVDFITLGEALGSIDLTFSINYKKYKASWRLRTRKKNGEELKKPQLTRLLFILQPDGQELAIDTTAEEICNLSFNQFCKTTILNQGEFSRFLTSNFTERKEILEKFYQGESLDTLNNFLKIKLKENLSKKEEKENLVKGISESFSDLNFTEKDIENLKRVITNNKSYLDSANELITNIKDALNLSETIKNTHERNKIIAIKQNETQSLFNEESLKVDLIQNDVEKQTIKLAEIKPILNQAIKKEINSLSIQKRIAQLKEQAHTNKNNLTTSTAEINDIEKKCEKLKEERAIFPRLISKFNEIEVDGFLKEFNHASMILNESRGLKNDLDLINEDRETKKKTLQEIKRTKDNFQKENSKIDFGKTNSLLEDNSKSLDQMNIMVPSLKNFLDFKNKVDVESPLLESSISKLTEESDSKSDELLFYKQEKLDLEKILKLYKLTDSIQMCREESVSKKECIICGNTNLDLKSEVDELDSDDFINTQLRLEKNTENTTKTQNNLNTLKVKLLSTQNEYRKILDEFELKSEMIKNDLAKISFFTTKEPLNQSTLDSLVQKQQETRELIQKLTSELQLFQINEEKIIHQNTLLVNINTDLEKLDALYKAKKNKKDEHHQQIQSIMNKYLSSPTVTKESWKEFEGFKQDVQRYGKINQELEISSIKKEGLDQYLEKLKKESEAISLETESLDDENQLIQIFLKENTSNCEPSKELKQLEDSLSEITIKFNQKAKTLKLIEIQLAEFRSKVDINNEQNKTSQVLRAAIILNIIKISKHLNNLKVVELEDFDKIFKITKKLSQLREDEFSLEILYETFTQYGESIKLLKEFSLNNEKKLSEYTALEKQRKENQDKVRLINDELKILLKKQYELDELNQLIGKDEFRNYVLAIIENLLLEQTNKELKILCQGRYGIIQTNRTNKMASEFKIVDFFMDGLERKISTLSGGETFLVSLAMAMALAELTRGNTQIDSLFIDEGFGTLDSDSINEVYELLLEIQHSGKQIGVISHISDLTSRIPVNINLVKNQNGLSDINILLN
jgi:exonuclease SbcC